MRLAALGVGTGLLLPALAQGLFGDVPSKYKSFALAATQYAWRVSFLDKRGVRGAAAPRISFSKKMLFDGAFVNIGSFYNLFFLFYKEENRELGAIFCLLACCCL